MCQGRTPGREVVQRERERVPDVSPPTEKDRWRNVLSLIYVTLLFVTFRLESFLDIFIFILSDIILNHV